MLEYNVILLSEGTFVTILRAIFVYKPPDKFIVWVWRHDYLKLLVNANDSIAQSFSSQPSDFNFLEFEELLSRSKKLFDDIQTIHEAVETPEDQMLLKG